MSVMTDREVRSVQTELRAAPGKPKVSGTAIVFNTWSDVGGFFERIDPSALDNAGGLDDLLLVWGHDNHVPLARTGAGLTTRITPRGLEFDADLVDTQAGRDVAELVRARICRGCSFGFTPDRGGDVVEYRGGVEYRTVTKIRQLWELTLTPIPAYPTTSVGVREKEALERLERAAPNKTTAEKLEQLKRIAGTSFGDENRKRPAGSTQVREVDPYGKGSPYSWIVDQAIAARDASGSSPPLPGDPPRPDFPILLADLFPPSCDPNPGNAQERMKKSADRQTRAGVGVSVDAAGGYFAQPVPQHWADAFVIGQHSAEVVAPLCTRLPLELHHGKQINIPMITNATTAAFMAADGASISNTDFITSAASSNINTILGSRQVASQQLYDLAGGPGLDEFCARELGAAVAEKLEYGIINGTGAANEPLGLLNQVGINTTAYTDGTPTVPELWPLITQNWNTTMGVRKQAPNVGIWHPRRWAWLSAFADTTTQPILNPAVSPSDDPFGEPHPVGVVPPGLRIYVSNQVPSNLGVGTNQDALLMFKRNDPHLYTSPVYFKTAWQASGYTSTLQLNLVAYRYVSFLGNRYPGGIGVIGGTGLATVSGWS